MFNEGRRFVSSVLNGKNVTEWIKRGGIGHLFSGESETQLHDFVQDFVAKHGELPSTKFVKQELDVSLPTVEGPAGYHFDRLDERFVERELRQTIEAALVDLSKANGDYDPRKTLADILDAVGRLRLDSDSSGSVVDYRTEAKNVYLNYFAELNGEADVGLRLGWPSLDGLGDGIRGGDLVSFVGRPEVGKTFFLLWSACRVWRDSPLPIAFVTQEMSGSAILKRLSAIDAGLPLSYVMPAGMLTPQHHERWKEARKSANEHSEPFHIIDGRMASTVPDVRLWCAYLKPGAIYVDGAYLLAHADKRLGRYERVAENCDLLKRMAVELDVPVVCTWQFNREATKKKMESLDLEHIAYSDAVGQHSSLVLAIVRPEPGSGAGGSEEAERLIRVLKGRSGQVGELRVHWNLLKCDFSEVVAKSLSDLNEFSGL